MFKLTQKSSKTKKYTKGKIFKSTTKLKGVNNDSEKTDNKKFILQTPKKPQPKFSLKKSKVRVRVTPN